MHTNERGVDETLLRSGTKWKQEQDDYKNKQMKWKKERDRTTWLFLSS